MALHGVHYSVTRSWEQPSPHRYQGEAMTRVQIQIAVGIVVVVLLLGVGAILLNEAQAANPVPEPLAAILAKAAATCEADMATVAFKVRPATVKELPAASAVKLIRDCSLVAAVPWVVLTTGDGIDVETVRSGTFPVVAALKLTTAPLVVEGCIMMRKCHLNTCPVGVATQDPELRKKFSGKPEHVVNFFFFIAEEAREIMAQLGIRKFDDLIGRVDLLDTRKGIENWKVHGLDFTKIFAEPQVASDVPRYQVLTQDHGLANALDNILIEKSEPAIERGEKVSFIVPVKNVNRTVGAMLSGEVAQRYGHAGLPDDTIHIQLNGTAGQSFAAFLARGITLDLVGDGNDYVGKGLSGGRVIVRAPHEFRGDTSKNIIVGNTVLYGAIAGEAFFNGVAGERFAVRNSGATTVVEGTGDHGCEYMTGGTVVVLGTTGRNFAAGMSGGVAYVYDEDGLFGQRCNTSMATLEKVLPSAEQISKMPKSEWHAPVDVKDGGERLTDEQILKGLIERHFRYTGSERAKALLADWENARTRFVKVLPTEYKRALGELWEKSQKKTVAA